MKKRAYCGNRLAKLRFLMIDFFVDSILSIIGHRRNENEIIPQKILLFNYGHLGDLLMMGYMINVLKIRHPQAEIHLVAGRWNKILIEKNPLYDEIFYLDHFQTNRQLISLLKKYFLYIKDIFLVIELLRKEQYSHSFNFRYSGYNANQFLPFLNIQQKHGFGTRGLGGLLDKEYFLLQDGTHTIDIQGQGLNNIEVEIDSENIQPAIFFSKDLLTPINPSSKYFVIFPEAGSTNRMFSVDFWENIIKRIFLESIDSQIVICGVTEFNKVLANALNTKYPNKIIDATNTLKIPQLIILLKKAEGAITLDSFPAHLASTQTKTLCLFKKGSGNEYFPINSFPIQIIHDHYSSKNVINFRENMTINYVENFESQAFEEIVTQSINDLFCAR